MERFSVLRNCYWIVEVIVLNTDFLPAKYAYYRNKNAIATNTADIELLKQMAKELEQKSVETDEI